MTKKTFEFDDDLNERFVAFLKSRAQVGRHVVQAAVLFYMDSPPDQQARILEYFDQRGDRPASISLNYDRQQAANLDTPARSTPARPRPRKGGRRP